MVSRAASWVSMSLVLATLLSLRTAAATAQLNADLTSPSDAAGGPFDVSPIAVVIAKGQTSSSVVVRSSGGESHFTVGGYRWTQDESGKMSFEPADELIFFPQTFTLSGGKTERIRIGAQGVDPSVEHTYRIIVYQLPPKIDPGQGKRPSIGMGFSLRVSVPIFVEPSNPKQAVDVALAVVRGDDLGVDVAATGNIHVPPSVVHVVATDVNGKSVVDTKSNVWYTLAGTKTHVDVPILHAQCSQIARVKLDLQDMLGRPLTTRDVTDPQKNCK